MNGLRARIDGLSDQAAIDALALALERRREATDAFSGETVESRVRDALAQPSVAEAIAPDPTATRGGLARLALTRLARDDAETVERAIDASRGGVTRFDPATLAIGAMVLVVFHSEIELERDPEKGWKFRFHTKPLSDSTVGELLSQLLGVFGKS